MPLAERLQLLAAGLEMPISIFDRDGTLVAASDAAGSLLDLFSQADLEQAHGDALMNGHVEFPISIGNVVLQRVGSGADIGVVVLIIPHAGKAEAEMTPDEDTPQDVAPPAEMPIPAYEQPALVNEAPAEFALIDEFAEPLEMELLAPEPAPTESKVTIDKTTAEPEKPRDEKPQDEKERDAPPAPRRDPLRFIWQMDADGHFSLGSDEFSWLIGARTAAGFGRPWDEIAQAFGLDPADKLREAIATRETWSGVTLYWPVDGGGRLPVELSGLPVFGDNGEYRRLSRVWRVPRSRQPRASRHAAPARAGRRSGTIPSRRHRPGQFRARRRRTSARRRGCDGRWISPTVGLDCQ